MRAKLFTPQCRIALGGTALACYAVHAGFHLIHHRPEDLLWACHLGSLFIGIGLLFSSASVAGIGTLWLCLGTPLWLQDLASGGEFHPTSSLTHLVGLAIGLCGVRMLGLPRGTWWRSLLALLVLIAACRLLTPVGSNVNMAFTVPAGWTHVFSSYGEYLTTNMMLAAVCFFLIELLLRRVLAPKVANRERQ